MTNIIDKIWLDNVNHSIDQIIDNSIADGSNDMEWHAENVIIEQVDQVVESIFKETGLNFGSDDETKETIRLRMRDAFNQMFKLSIT